MLLQTSNVSPMAALRFLNGRSPVAKPLCAKAAISSSRSMLALGSWAACIRLSSQTRMHSPDSACPMGGWAACMTSEHSDYAGPGRLGSLHQTQHSDWSAQSPGCVCASPVGITEPASIDLIKSPLQRVERWAVRQLSTLHQAAMASAAGQLEM